MSILAARLKEISNLPSDRDFLVLDSASYESKVAIARNLSLSSAAKEATFDATDEESKRIREWLRSVPLQGKIYALWASFGEGIECNYNDFVSYFDDLWFPASDDLWIINPESTVLVELDHEEQFSWVSSRA